MKATVEDPNIISYRRKVESNFNEFLPMTSGLVHACPQCEKTYRWRRNLTRHLNFECGKEPRFRCPSCSRGFSQKTSLKRRGRGRGRRKPVAEPGSYPCERCGKEYGYRKNMLQHLRYECGMEPQFRCPQCIRRFRRNSHLRSHIFSKHPPEVVMECLPEAGGDGGAASAPGLGEDRVPPEQADLGLGADMDRGVNLALATYRPSASASSSAPVSPAPSATSSPLASTPPASPASLF
ncbi:Zinc finger and SCAN domain-containing protein 10 [Frankliniella fusca]|uniref:Zinc finger and SCAN domain-containing protein 10 n=1 Tax=Frankliniella fusca TaxID=407009 RepID=A0AAE1H6G0_9NEOP|nr:Zinc finger and SCAN domain-containing protein 10 [Frankliniella fusca]